MGDCSISSDWGERRTSIALLLAGLLLTGAVTAGLGIAPAAAESQNTPNSVVVADAANPQSADWFDDDDADVSVSVDDNVTAEPGSTVSVDVTAESNGGSWWLTNGEVDYFTLTLEYDEEKLDFEGVNGSDIGSVEVIDEGDGYVTLENEYGFGDLFASNDLPLTMVTPKFTVVGEGGEAEISPSEESTVGYGFGLYTYEHDVAYEAGDLTIDNSDNGGDVERTYLRATNEGGWVAFNEENKTEARADGIELPEGEFVVVGELDESGAWRSTNIETPRIELDGGIDLQIGVEDGFTGQFDREDDAMTAEGELSVTILTDGSPQFNFFVIATTSESGELTGGAKLDDGGGSATLVDNQYTVDDTTGNTLFDNVLGLPIEEPGRSWLELPLDVELEQGPPEPSFAVDLSDAEAVEGDSVEIQGTVENTGYAAGEQAVTLAVGGQSVTESIALAPGEDETVTLTWDTSEGDAGEYEATIQSDDDSESAGVSLAEAVREFEIVDTTGDQGAEGDALDIEATVQNTGNAAGQQEVTATVADQTLTQTVELARGESKTVLFTWETSEGDAGEYEATIETEDDSAPVDVVVGESREEAIPFRAVNTGGWVAFDTANQTEARTNGFNLPNGQLVIEGEIVGSEGTWRSTNIQTPVIELDNGLDLELEIPDGFSGQIDREKDTMTGEGQLSVTVLADGNPQFNFSVATTTNQSGELSGTAAFENGTGTVTLVDNQYTVEDTTGSLIDAVLGLPIEEPGRAWLELPLDAEFNPDPREASYDVDVSSKTVTAGDTVDINATVQNTGDGAGQQEVTLAVANQSTTETVALGPGESQTLSLSWATSEADIGEYEATVESDDDSDSAPVTVETPVTAFEVVDVESSYAAEGEPIDIETTIENTGNTAGQQQVTATIAGKSFSETVAIDPGSSETVVFTWETSEGDAGEYEATIETEDDTDSFLVTVSEPPTGQLEFEATNRGGDDTEAGGGWISFAEDSRTEAIDEGLAFPVEGISITGIVDGQTWESTSVEFPTLVTESGIEAAVEAPNGLVGTFNYQNDTVTAEGELEVTILAGGNESFSFDITATTGKSGGLTGEASIGGEAGTATLVDNEFTIDDQTLNPIVDGALGLPIEEPGRAWLALPLEFDIEQA